MELALSLEKLTNEKLLNLHKVTCLLPSPCFFYFNSMQLGGIMYFLALNAWNSQCFQNCAHELYRVLDK
jgi:hypothetical protein